MVAKSGALLVAAMTAAQLAGCGASSWIPWSRSSGDSAGPGLPPGAEAYVCQGGKRLVLRLAPETKSAWVIHPRGEYRLDRDAAAAGERYSRGRSVLTIVDGSAELSEEGKVEFTGCRVAPGK